MPESRVFGADEVARKEFPTSFRGFDQHAVRAFLGRLAAELAALQTRERSLEERLTAAEARAVPTEIGETELENALGVEAAKVLHAAREAAAEIRSRSEEQVARLLRDASDEAGRLREEAGSVLAARTAEAERAAATILEEATRGAAERRAEAAAAAEATIESAKEEGRRMVGEAHAVRERILKDLARRRRTGHQQLEQLRAGRDRLLQACRDVRAALDTAVGELVVSEPEARAAAETAALRVVDEPEMSLEELDAEVVAAVHAGLVGARGRAGAGEQPGEGGGPTEDEHEPTPEAASVPGPEPVAEGVRGEPQPPATESPADPTFAEIVAAQANRPQEWAAPAQEHRASPLRRRKKRGAPASVSVVDDRDQSEGVRLIPNEPASTPASEPEDAAVASRAGPSEGTEAVDDDDQERPSLTLVAPERAEELSPSRPGAGEPAAGTDEPATAGEGHGAPVDVADQPAVEPERPGLDEQP
ncbi:MAG: DivIVA domain-containing protein, partial [Acidimicrobiales bacterium]